MDFLIIICVPDIVAESPGQSKGKRVRMRRQRVTNARLSFMVMLMEHKITPLKQSPDGLAVDDAAHLLVALAQKSGCMNQTCNENEFFRRMRAVADAFSKALQESEQSVTFIEAAEFSLLARLHRRPSTVADLRSYITRMCDYPAISNKSIRMVTISDCRKMLKSQFGHSVHSYRKAQSILHSVFNHAMRQRWCDYNPAKAILRPPVHENRIEILTISQISRFIRACKSDDQLARMEAALRLMLWCGVRPTEVRRLTWGDIDFREELVYIDPIASKTGGARAVPLRGGARALLNQKQHDKHIRIAPANWDRLWRDLRQKAQFNDWQNDALRHTFASMHLKRFHNLALLQEEMGHRNSALLQTRYLNLRNLTKNAARQFFSSDSWGEM